MVVGGGDSGGIKQATSCLADLLRDSSRNICVIDFQCGLVELWLHWKSSMQEKGGGVPACHNEQ